MHQIHSTLSENIRTQSVALPNKHLAAAIDLHGQIKQAHWNVRGPTFIAVHMLFDEVAETALDASDLLAERAAGLVGTAEGTVQMASTKSYPVPDDLGVPGEARPISAALVAFGQSMPEAAGWSATQGDATTADLFTEISRGIDRQLWFVESSQMFDLYSIR